MKSLPKEAYFPINGKSLHLSEKSCPRCLTMYANSDL